MKRIRQLFSLFIISLCMFVSVNNVNAADYDDSPDVGDYYSSFDSIGGTRSNLGAYNNGTIYDLTDDAGNPVYCLNAGKNFVGGATYKRIETKTNSGYACAVLNYMKTNNNYTMPGQATEASGYVALQKAIWDGSDNATCDAVKTNSQTTTASLKLSSNSNKFTLDTTGSEYISSEITVSKNNVSTYNISLKNAPSGSYITESSISGNRCGETTTATKLYIHIPVNNVDKLYNNIELSVSASYVSETYDSYSVTEHKYNYCANSGQGTCYGPDTNSSVQIGGVELNTGNVGFQYLSKYVVNKAPGSRSSTVTFTLNFSIPTGSVEITKINSKTEGTIQGAVFKLYKADGKTEATYANGSVIGELTTNSSGKITINNLLFGDYVLKEIASAEGYLTNQEKYPIQISNTTVTPIKITNNPVLTKISKKDIANENELEGAHIVITDAQGNIVHEFDSTKGSYEFYLGPGKYNLKETVAPNGYDLVETVFEFEVKNNGDVKLLSTESDYFKTNSNEIILYNSVTIVEVPDTLKTNVILSIVGISLSLVGGVVIVLNIRNRKINEI